MQHIYRTVSDKKQDSHRRRMLTDSFVTYRKDPLILIYISKLLNLLTNKTYNI